MSSCRRSGCTHRSQAVLVARAAMHWTLHLCLNYSRYIQRQISICYVIRFMCIIRKNNRVFGVVFGIVRRRANTSVGTRISSFSSSDSLLLGGPGVHGVTSSGNIIGHNFLRRCPGVCVLECMPVHSLHAEGPLRNLFFQILSNASTLCVVRVRIP